MARLAAKVQDEDGLSRTRSAFHAPQRKNVACSLRSLFALTVSMSPTPIGVRAESFPLPKLDSVVESPPVSFLVIPCSSFPVRESCDREAVARSGARAHIFVIDVFESDSPVASSKMHCRLRGKFVEIRGSSSGGFGSGQIVGHGGVVGGASHSHCSQGTSQAGNFAGKWTYVKGVMGRLGLDMVRHLECFLDCE